MWIGRASKNSWATMKGVLSDSDIVLDAMERTLREKIYLKG